MRRVPCVLAPTLRHAMLRHAMLAAACVSVTLKHA